MPGRAETLNGLVVASHAAPTAVVSLLSVVLLVGLGAPAGTVALAGTAVLAGQLSVGWSNDWLDAGRDTAVGRTDKPVVAGLVGSATLRGCALAAATLCAVLSWATGMPSGTAHVAAVASAWTYNLGMKRTVWSWLPYALSFGLLAEFLVLAARDTPAPGWLVATGALLGTGAHVANVLPDLADDAATAVNGLPHRIGRRASAVLAPALLVAAALVAVLGGPDMGAAGLVAAGVSGLLAVGAGAVGATRPRSRLPFVLSMAVAGVCVLLLATAGPRVLSP